MRLASKAAAAITALLIVSMVPMSAQAVPIPKRVANASAYIAKAQISDGSIPSYSTFGSTADSVVAMVAAGRGPVTVRKALRFLTAQVRTGAIEGAPAYDQVGLLAKAALAAVAAGRSPRDFGGENLLARIRATEEPDGRYGVETGSFNQALAVIALEAANVSASRRSMKWLIGAQCADGGWAYDGPPQPSDDEHCVDTNNPTSDYFSSDTNTTSLVIQARRLARGPIPAAAPFAFFKAARDGSAGWGYQIGYGTDANSTGMVIQAYVAAGKRLPDGSMSALKSLQDTSCGGFKYSNDSWVTGPDVASTLGGILGLLRRPLPIEPSALTPPPSVPDCA